MKLSNKSPDTGKGKLAAGASSQRKKPKKGELTDQTPSARGSRLSSTLGNQMKVSSRYAYVSFNKIVGCLSNERN